MVVARLSFKVLTKIIICSKMINEEASQSILVIGETGSGKTKSTKTLMHYLAFLGGRATTEGRSVEQQVLEVRNKILRPCLASVL